MGRRAAYGAGDWHQPGTNVKVFAPNRELADKVAGLTGETFYALVNRLLARELPKELQRAFNKYAREMGGESGEGR